MLTSRLGGVLFVASTLAGAVHTNPAAPTVAVQVTISVEPRHAAEAPVLNPEDVLVYQHNERLPVASVVPCTGDHGALELFVLIDDASSWTLGSQWIELRHFVGSQPATTSIGIGYLRNATVNVVANLTTDHAKAAKALRLPLGSGGVMPSPFLSLSDLIRRWPASSARHEVILISSGIDALGYGITDPYLDSAIDHAQRAGVTVYAIYTPSAGHFRHSPWRMNWGQINLAKLAEETGGESYMLGFGPPVTIDPYFADITQHLAHQYLVTFLARPATKAGFQSVRITTEVPNAEIVAPGKVYVAASPK